jgi:hypothetical protein
VRRIALIAVVSIGVAAPLLFVFVGGLVPRWMGWHEDQPCDEFVVALGTGEIRARAFVESGWTMVSKAYHYVDVRTGPDGAWRNVLRDFGADPGPISRERVVVVNPTTAFARLNRRFAVTTDGGESWIVREVQDMWRDATGEHVPSDEAGLWALRIDGDGSGTATIRIYMRDEQELATSDFGRTWRRR